MDVEGKAVKIKDLSGPVLLLGFMSLGITIGIFWARTSLPSTPILNAEFPAPRKIVSRADLQQRETKAHEKKQQKKKAIFSLDQKGIYPQTEDPGILAAMDALHKLQQRNQGPDDDDAVAAVIARELERHKQAVKSISVDIQGKSQHKVQESLPLKKESADAKENQIDKPNKQQPFVDMVEKLGLANKVDLSQLAAPDSNVKQQPVTPVPAYKLNTMPDEPPYGTPPDPNPNPNPKLYCMVLTTPQHHEPKGIAINKTWGVEFDGLGFMTSAHYPGLNTVLLPIREEDRKDLWVKTRQVINLKSGHNLYIHPPADDDSYVMVDNLRALLSKYDPEKPHFFGRRFLLHRGQRDKELSYHSGGAGYVLSRKALKMIGDNAVSVLQKSGTVEDVEMGRTMVKLGITCEDTRDETGRERFLPLSVQRLRYEFSKSSKPNFWYWAYSYYPPRDGLDMYTIHELHKKGKEAAGIDPEKQEW
eukprot:gene2973-8184_t